MLSRNCTILLLAVGAGFCLGSISKAQGPAGVFIDHKPVYDDDSRIRAGSVSDDGLTLYLSTEDQGGFGSRDLFQATRNSIDEPFGNLMNLGEKVNSAARDSSPRISADGMSLYFSSTRDGVDGDLFVATRGSVSEPFGNATNLGAPVNTSAHEGGVAVSRDGLTLYFVSERDGDRDLYQATRSSTSDPFGSVHSLGAEINSPTTESSASPSADQLTLFFGSRRPNGDASSSDIWFGTRNSLSDSFGPASRAGLMRQAIVFAPYVSPEWPAVGSKIYYSRTTSTGSSDFDVYESTWVPEPSSLSLMAIAALGVLGLTRRGTKRIGV